MSTTSSGNGLYSTVHAMGFRSVLCCAVQYSTVQYSTVHSTVQSPVLDHSLIEFRHEGQCVHVPLHGRKLVLEAVVD
jgi:hypothetical protein